MSRAEFPVSVRRAALARAAGICECGCGRPFTDHPQECPTYDHDLPDYLGGKPTLENCKALRVDCHKLKTRDQDMPHIVKARRGQKDRQGLQPIKRKIPGSKGTGLRKKMDGSVVRVSE